MIAAFWSDCRRALRQAARAPSFSVAVVLVIAVGLGINATLNSVLYAVVLRPIAAPNPHELVAIARLTDQGQRRSTHVRLLDALGADPDLFVEATPYWGGAIVTIDVDGGVSARTAEFVGGDYFRMLGARAAVGRLPTREDASANPVVVLSHRLWREAFGGDASVIGRELRVEGVPLTVTGVIDTAFSGLQVDVAADLVVPASLLPRVMDQPSQAPRAASLVVRLHRAVSLEQARARIEQRWTGILPSVPADMTSEERRDLAASRFMVEPIGHGFSPLRRRYGTALYLLSGLSWTLLALTVVNIAALLLGRVAGRREELFVRASLGATRGRLACQLLAETGVFAFMGTIAAIPLAWWGSQALGAASWNGLLPMTLRVKPDWQVLAVTMLLGGGLGAAVAVLAAGSLPRRLSDRHTDREIGRSSRLSRSLLACQVALSVALVFTAGLLIRTFDNLQSSDSGVRGSRRVLLMKLVPRPGGYENLDERLYYPALAERLSALPSVVRVSFSQLFPAVANEAPLFKAVRTLDAEAPAQQAIVDVVSPHFFDTTGITRLSGRDLSWSDDERTPGVALLNAALARRLFGDEDAVGQHVVIGTGAQEQIVEIVGVVATATMGNLRSRGVPVLFRPTLQARRSAQSPFVEIRMHGDPRALGAAARKAVESMGREYPLTTHTLDEYIQRSLVRERTTAGVAGIFGGFALVLACAGIYAQLAHGVTRRTREIGLRMAIGASRSSVARAVAWDAMLVTMAGAAAGVPLAIAVAGVWKSVLFEVTPADSTTIALVMLGFLTVAAAAAWVPARRASTIEPIVALRTE
ncbi:MAG: ABC transporter permease [Vicinamibacterales bacterium]